MRVAALGAPAHFKRLLGRLPRAAVLTQRLAPALPMIVAFVPDVATLEHGFGRWKRSLARDGALWLCWPKRSSGIVTDIGEHSIRDYALAQGLVDVKVCAIDATWSGLKCVYRVKDR
jgi:hypothetical protein